MYALLWTEYSSRLKFPLPEKMSCIVSSGCWVVGGSYSGKIYVWDVTSGSLMTSWEAHYGAVTTIAISPDESAILSGGEDANLYIWLTTRVLDMTSRNTNLAPELSLSDHTMPITGISIVGSSMYSGSFMSGGARIFTSSKDQTVKCWQINQGQDSSNESLDYKRRIGTKKEDYKMRADLLITWLLPSVVKCLVVDSVETRVFCGCLDGKVYQIDLYSSYSIGKRAKGYVSPAMGGGQQVVVQIGHENNDSAFVGHGASVNSVSLSMDGSLLVSGSSDSTVKVWDTASKQCLRTISETKAKESKTSSSNNLSTLVTKGISQVAVVMRPVGYGRVVGYTNVSKELGNPDSGNSTNSNSMHAEHQFELKRKKNEKRNYTNPLFSVLQRTQTPAINAIQRSSGAATNIIRTNLSNKRNSLKLIGGYAGSGFSLYHAKGRLPNNTTPLPGQLSQIDESREQELTDQITKLKGEMQEITSKYAKLKQLNDSLYESTVAQLLKKSPAPVQQTPAKEPSPTPKKSSKRKKKN
ncbi:WD repeat-containing protein 18 [Smittium mucronatum]|uniref:WD repeat-containing protein 18 n=1 Tax=Smittium mucronatum TaxID=133383 RepID=A0A1R0H7Q5_9FUNG|nr:WD repeat-containing protein 18 [Smittium mucronatum]